MNKNDIQIRTHAETIPGTPLIQSYPGSVPSTPIIWPALSHTRNQIQQTKINSTPRSANVLPSTQPSASMVASRNTPAPVSRVRIVSQTVGDQKRITVKFTHPAGDIHFQGASVYLKRAGQQPVQVASGSKSPLTFTVAKSSAPHSVHITSFGPWGETNVDTAPSSHVRLG